MQVEIDEVVGTIRVRGGRSYQDPQEKQQLVEAVLRAVDQRLARKLQRGEATGIEDDGRGGISRQQGGPS
ncbi:MAG: hypothetical protein WD341_16255 [Tistlia sp.]|uniref:hypothetical protein n=1 Tax=Tistlia sp. TaxID=3057121 RepID=UPI0034A2AA8D